MSVDVLDLNGKVVGSVSLPAELFGASVNPKLMAQAVRVYLANQRKGTVSTKTRGEVTGSTRKIYRQKGTGRARHGGIRAPIFVGGGLVFGPKPRDYSMSLPQKMRRAALASALTTKLQDGQVSVIAGLTKVEPKTKVMAGAFKPHLTGKKPTVLFVIPSDSKETANTTKAVRNLAGVTYISAHQLNTYEVLRATKLVLMQEAIDSLALRKGKEA